MSIGGLDHVALGVPDLDARVDMLVDLYAMRVVNRGIVPATGQRMTMLEDAHGIKLELIETPQATSPTFLHVAFRASDIDTAHDQALAHGFTSKRPPHSLNGDYARTALLGDPHGFDVQVIAYGPDSASDERDA